MATLGAQRKHKVTVVGSGNWYVPPHAPVMMAKPIVLCVSKGLRNFKYHIEELLESRVP
jgi:hypothetical protein